jgi:serine/threonine protein kinase/WD40 repeat protein
VTEESIFAAALEIRSPGPRAAYLDRACDGDVALRRQVEELLAAHAADNPLDRPAIDVGRTGAYEPGPADTPPAVPGDRIGPYRLMEQIGEGGFGLVFVAEQSEPVRRKVALKVLKPGMDTRDIVARFEAERQALALMDHPNIARVLDAGASDKGRPYFVMELVRGVPITNYCDENRLPPRERLALFIQVCQAVQHAHQKGIIHRDLKPTNILVAPHDGVPVVKVIDFGVAKALGQSLTEKTLYTKFAQMIGTPLYMSPEQAEINQLDVDTRADVYALGVLLYELLTGTTPFDRDRFRKAAYDEIRRIIREEDPPKPSTRLTSLGATLPSVSASRGTEPGKLPGLVRGELDWIVMKCLEKDRNRRYDTANGLAKDIQRYLAGDAVDACPPTVGYRLRKLARRYRGVVAVAGGLAAVLLLGIALTAWQAIRATRAEAEAARQRDVAMAAREVAAAERDHATAVSRSLQRVTTEQRRTLYATSMNLAQAAWETGNPARLSAFLREQLPVHGEEDLRGFEWDFWERLIKQERRTVQIQGVWSGEQFSPPVLSPDGSRVAALVVDRSGSSEIKVFDADGGREMWKVPTSAGRSISGMMAFSGDGRRFAASRPVGARAGAGDGSRYDVTVWDAGTGTVVLSLPSAADSSLVVPALSHDGSRLSVFRRTGPPNGRQYQLTVHRVPGGDEVFRYPERPGGLGVLYPTFSADGRQIFGETLRIADFSAVRFRSWDLETGRQVIDLPVEGRAIQSNSRYSPDGSRIAVRISTDVSDRLVLLNAADGRKLEEHPLPSIPVRGAVQRPSPTFSPDGTLLAVPCEGQVYLFETVRKQDERPEGKPRVIRGLGAGIVGVAFVRGGQGLLTLDVNGAIKSWDVEAPGPRLTAPFESALLQARSLPSPDGTRVAILDQPGATGRVLVRTIAGDTVLEKPLPGGHCDDTCFSRDGRTFSLIWHNFPATTSDFTVHLWTAGGGAEGRSLTAPSGWNAALGLSADGSLVAATTVTEPGERPWYQSTLTVWETATGRRLFERAVGTCDGDSWPAFGPDNAWMAVTGGREADGDSRVEFLEPRTGVLKAALKVGRSKIQGLGVSADGRFLAVTRQVGASTALSVWEVGPILAGETREPVVTLIGHGDRIVHVAFSPDGRRILTCGGGTAKLWDATSGREVLTLRADGAAVGNCYFSPDGRTIWAGLDEHGRLWGWDGRPMTEAGSP